MSTQIKCIIPFIDNSMTKDYIKPESGFVNGYIYDQNRPSLENCLFLMYDDTLNTVESKMRWMKLRSFSSLRSVKHIRVNKKPYTVYTFQFFDSNSRSLFKNRTPVGDQASRILQFWGLDDKNICERILNPTIKIFGIDTSSVPEDDYEHTKDELRFVYKNRMVVNK